MAWPKGAVRNADGSAKRNPDGTLVIRTGRARKVERPEPERKPDRKPEPVTDRPKSRSEEAAKAVRDQFGAGPGGAVASDPGAAPQGPERPSVPSVDWSGIVRMTNTIVRTKSPQLAMLDYEEAAISESIGPVMAKYFPNAAEYGPETTLLVALTAYVVRILLARPSQPESEDTKPEPGAERFGLSPVQ